MPARLAVAARELFRREMLPARVRWWFAAEGLCNWYALLARELAPHLGGAAAARAALSEIVAPMLARRYDELRRACPSLPDRGVEPRAAGLAMGALHRVASHPGVEWVFDAVGGAPVTFAEHLRAERWLAPLPSSARWIELTHHLGEVLVALTEALSARMDRVRPILGAICFEAGVRSGRRMKKAFALGDGPDAAFEVLRMSEYVFRVNPEHWARSDAASTGWLEGTACPWYVAPGWNGAHCGIFGQFQSGVASAFGLRYHLTSTIPKHGGHTCRIDVRPPALVPLRRREEARVA